MKHENFVLHTLTKSELNTSNFTRNSIVKNKGSKQKINEEKSFLKIGNFETHENVVLHTIDEVIIVHQKSCYKFFCGVHFLTTLEV